MTIYSAYASKEAFFLPTTTVHKVEDVRQISKPLELSLKKNNHNLYAIVGDNLDILCLGTVKKETIKNNTIYVGQKVYAFDKKILCDYYQYKVRNYCKKQEDTISASEHILSATQNAYATFYTDQIHRCRQKIKDAQRQYKLLIKNIKQL